MKTQDYTIHVFAFITVAVGHVNRTLVLPKEDVSLIPSS